MKIKFSAEFKMDTIQHDLNPNAPNFMTSKRIEISFIELIKGWYKGRNVYAVYLLTIQ